MREPQARPARMALSTATRLITGSEPGWPRQTGQVSEFGGAPKRFSHPQNIFDRVESWTWTSRPMTDSQPAWAEAGRGSALATAGLLPPADRGLFPVEARRLLEGVGEPERHAILEGAGEDLGPHRQATRGGTTRGRPGRARG